MIALLTQLIVRLWNRLRSGQARHYPGDLVVGRIHRLDGTEGGLAVVRRQLRPQHLAVLGKTGLGKTSLLRAFAEQDIQAHHGFVFFDLHGQTTEPLLSAIAEGERAAGRDTSGHTILIDPADRFSTVGINPLTFADGQDAYIRVAEIVDVLKSRWHLDSFGARTDELLRNSLMVLSLCGLTLLELEPLLVDSSFRNKCLHRAPDGPAKTYFQQRFEALSAPMRAVVVEPVLNKITAFTSDPHIRHLVGQAASTVDFRAVLEKQQRVIVNLNKGLLGVHALTLGSLVLTQLKSALFGRRSRKVFSFYCDEIQNLVVYDEGLESLLAEARKFGVSIVAANQYLDQLTPAMRAALLSAGTLAFFQLASPDALRIAHLLGEGPSMAKRLRTLPTRHLLLQTGDFARSEIETPFVNSRVSDTRVLRRRIATRWGRPRADVERQIRDRYLQAGKELDGWE